MKTTILLGWFYILYTHCLTNNANFCRFWYDLRSGALTGAIGRRSCESHFWDCVLNDKHKDSQGLYLALLNSKPMLKDTNWDGIVFGNLERVSFKAFGGSRIVVKCEVLYQERKSSVFGERNGTSLVQFWLRICDNNKGTRLDSFGRLFEVSKWYCDLFLCLFSASF